MPVKEPVPGGAVPPRPRLRSRRRQRGFRRQQWGVAGRGHGRHPPAAAVDLGSNGGEVNQQVEGGKGG